VRGRSGTVTLMRPRAIDAILKREIFDVEIEGGTSVFVAS